MVKKIPITADLSLLHPDELGRWVGERLAEHRLTANLTRETLARRAGVSAEAIKVVETRGRSSLATLARLLSALGLQGKLQALFALEPAKSIAELERREAASLRKKSSHEDRFVRTLEVRYHGDGPEVVLGRLAATRDGTYFEHSAEAIALGVELSPIKLKLQGGALRGPSEPFGGLHGLFNDSLPDGFGAMLLDRWIQHQGKDPRAATALDRLAIIGSRAMGALSYHPETGPASSPVEWNLAAAEAELDRVAEGKSSAIIPELLLAGGSPQGARPKLLLLLSEDGSRAISGPSRIPSGYVPSLIKFAAGKRADTESRLEEVYARMARAAGIRMPATRLIDVGKGRVAFAAHRFDRRGSARIHMHSASGLLEVDHRAPALDYDSLLRLARALTRSQAEVEAMYRLAVFNVLGQNRDDHAKNFAFLRDARGSWSLSPGFDLTFSSGPGGEHTTSVLGRGKDIPVDVLRDLGAGASIPVSTCDRIIDDVRAAVATFPQIASELDVPRSRANQIAKALGVR